MYSTSELERQREAMLVKQIEYLREACKFMEMAVSDIKMRNNIVADIKATIRRCGMELGGHPEEDDRRSYGSRGAASAGLISEGTSGC